MACDESGLEQEMTQLSPPAANAASATQGAAITGDRRKPGQGGGLFTGDLAKFRELRNQRCAGHRADSWHRAQDMGDFGQRGIGCYNLCAPIPRLTRKIQALIFSRSIS